MMDSQPNNPLPPKGEIRFPNDNRAVFVKTSPDQDAADLIKALEIKRPTTVLLLIGGADDLDPALNTQIEHLLEHGFALAAADTNALIIDGGIKAGVMALMGKVIALRGRVTPLLGVVPEGKVTYPGGPEEGSIAGGAALDPNHSHFVLAEGAEWSIGTKVMFKLANELAMEARVVVVLINGGDEALAEVKDAAKSGWPVVVIQGSGRLADKIAAEVTFANEGDFEVFGLNEEPGHLRQLLVRHGQGALLAEGALREAWSRFAQYDSIATVNQAIHKNLLSFSLVVGVLGTLFALAQRQFTGLEGRSFVLTASYSFAAVPLLLMAAASYLQIFKPRRFGYSWIVAGIASAVLFVLVIGFEPTRFLTYAARVFKYLAIATPIIVSTLITASNQFKNKRKWILLRRSAQAIKQEMFRYRTRVGDYADGGKSDEDPKDPASKPRHRDVVLAEKIVSITQLLMKTEANTASLVYEGPIPPTKELTAHNDGISFLTPERYLEVRLDDQLSYYRKQTRTLQRQRSEFQLLIFFVGGVGTLLAALGYQLWVALTTATVTALAAWVANLKLDPNLVKYNQTAADLSNLRVWWNTLSPDDKTKPDNKETLVNKTEDILEKELAGWVQQMEETTEEDSGVAKRKKKQG